MVHRRGSAWDAPAPRASDSGRSGIRRLIERLIRFITGGDEESLDEVSVVDTMRDVADADALTYETPPGWDVRSDIVRFGDDSLTDVLVFQHFESQQELVVVPLENTDPTGPVRFFHLDRKAGKRRKLPVAPDTLQEGLEYVLDRIERFEQVFGKRRKQLPYGH